MIVLDYYIYLGSEIITNKIFHANIRDSALPTTNLSVRILILYSTYLNEMISALENSKARYDTNS